MAGVLYYRSGGKRPESADVESWGIAAAFDADRRPVSTSVTTGPDQRGGVVFGRATPDIGSRIGYWPDRQVWVELPVEGLWLGYERSAPPTPYDLRRATLLDGHDVKLAGHVWHCPAALEHYDSDGAVKVARKLPGVLKWLGGSRWTCNEPKPQYADLWSIAMKFYDHLRGVSSGVRFEVDFSTDAAVKCLSANYYVGPAEASVLGLFDDDLRAAGEVLKALVDYPTWMVLLEKKAAAATPDTSPGVAA